MNDIAAIAAQFQPMGYRVVNIAPYGSGNINDTYRVDLAGGTVPCYILQRINQHVFRRPELIMRNLRTLEEHLSHQPDTSDRERWELPQVLHTQSGDDHVIDEKGGFWRALSFIEGAATYDEVRDARHAREAGYALGRFQRSISDLPTERLHDTLPGFHIMPHYLKHYDEVVHTCGIQDHAAGVSTCARFIEANRGWAVVLEEALARQELSLRPIHGDPKINNIMIDDQTGKAVSIIDLDTVKPGLVQYDIGDCLRSSCNPLGEETRDIDAVHFDLGLCRAILEGYLPQARGFYAAQDYHYVFDAVRVLAFEMGLRFFTDYLEGDVYFKVKYRQNNLMRAWAQFTLAASIINTETEIRQIVAEFAGKHR